ncbi:hypothetical protein ACFOEL_19115 [Virgibacillus litoralis]
MVISRTFYLQKLVVDTKEVNYQYGMHLNWQDYTIKGDEPGMRIRQTIEVNPHSAK